MVKFKVLSILSAVYIAVSSVSAQDLLGIDGEEATSIGVYIKDLQTSEILYDYNSEIALTPASVMKAITTATALGFLEEDFRFSTLVELKGSMAEKGVWQGDLIIHSSGDPTIESEHFESNYGFCDSICAGLCRIGIKSIEGKIIVDQTMSQAGPVAQWELEDIAWPYGAGLFGFNFRDNTCLVYPLTGETKPHVPGLAVKVFESKDGNDLFRGVGSNQLTVFARNMTNKKWSISTTMPDPSAVFTLQLLDKLQGCGIGVGGKTLKLSSPQCRTVYTHRSPVASEIMRSLMVRSDNLFAEGILRAIAPNDTRDNVIKQMKDLWRERGIDPKYSLIFDGSGLTRGNRLQPRFIADVLQWMVESPMAKTYVGFFPRAGIEGTMCNFLVKSSLKGKLALKTGSMNAVQCCAGYKLNDDGDPTHVIVIMVNGFFCKRPELKKSIEQLLIDTFI